MEIGGANQQIAVPLTALQTAVARLLAKNRTPESHLVGAAALMLDSQSPRMSDGLDYFHDEEAFVAAAYEADRAVLVGAGCRVTVQLSQPGFVRAVVESGGDATKVEWAHDSAWRFFPAEADPAVGYRLHPLDLAINKVLALVGRDEPRDFLDTLYVHQRILALPALVWAAVGKDPGFNPAQLAELLARKGRYHEQDFAALKLAHPVNLQEMKRTWLDALAATRRAVARWPASDAGLLYLDPKSGQCVCPQEDTEGLTKRSAQRGGVMPRIVGG